MVTYYAHSTKGEKSEWQTIQNHLTSTADLVLKLGKGTGVEQYAFVAALLHDIGKYSLAFQKRLEGASQRVDHSTAGAFEVKQFFHENSAQAKIAEMLSYCIAGHHSGLMDYGSSVDVETDGTLRGRLKKSLPDYSAYANEISLEALSFSTRLPVIPTTPTGEFTFSFFTRMVYSLLVDADFQDTETFVNGSLRPRGDFASLEELLNKLQRYLEMFSASNTSINHQRANTLAECIAAANDPTGLFTLTVPTGGGKTLSSLAFALTHARINHLNRVIYVIPYTTIIEQNAAVFKECLGEENVLEHHSNFDWENAFKTGDADDRTDQMFEKIKLSSENWDIPVVVTTNVQFFESLYANRSSRCRKIHNIAKSVLIFDEAQMLPRKYLEPCMKAVYELVKNYGVTAVFCTATQPVLDRFFPPATHFREITHEPACLYDQYRRVQVVCDGKLPDSEVVRRLNESEQALCIVNTRRHAQGLFQSLTAKNRFHLSTWMCPLHRREVVSEIRECLKRGDTCRVVSTQLMEAGVDLDFPVGYRALAGLDSIIQAAGRVNREGRQKMGILHVFEPDTSLIKRTPIEITQAAAVSKSILANFPEDPICLEAIRQYYQALYNLQDRYAFDANHILDCFEKGIPAGVDFDFETAARNFNIIEENTVSLIIPYDFKAKQLLTDATLLARPYLLKRRLQPFCVNIYEKHLDTLQREEAITFVRDDIPVLAKMQYYSQETGLLLPEEESGEAIFS